MAGDRKDAGNGDHLSVEDGAHQPIRFQYVATRRDDVSQIYFGRTVEKELGFDISSRMSAEKIII